MAYSVISPGEQPWLTRPHADGEPARHVAELSELAGMGTPRERLALRAGRDRPAPPPPVQDETFVVLAGTLSMYLGEPPERRTCPPAASCTCRPGRRCRASTTATTDLVVYAHGWPPEDEHAELLDSAV